MFHLDSESVKLARDGRHWNASEDDVAGLSFAVNTRPLVPRRATKNLCVPSCSQPTKSLRVCYLTPCKMILLKPHPRETLE